MLLRSKEHLRQFTGSLPSPGRCAVFFPHAAIVWRSPLLQGLEAHGCRVDGYPDESSHFVTGRMIWSISPRSCGNRSGLPKYICTTQSRFLTWTGYHLRRRSVTVFGSSRISDGTSVVRRRSRPDQLVSACAAKAPLAVTSGSI